MLGEMRGVTTGVMTPRATDCIVRQALFGKQVPIYRERSVQGTLASLFKADGLLFQREFDTGHGKIDFAVSDPGAHRFIGVEVKTRNGLAREVWRQLQRYSLCPSLTRLVLVTAGSHRMPPMTDNGKPVSVISLSEAWL